MSTLNYTKDFNLKRSLPLGKQIYDKLRDKIIYTELFPLTEIFESDLANKLNVSRTPIRDALKKLENDGLVETIPQG
jgi:DNA-binding GntR family transcriptional regulator